MIISLGATTTAAPQGLTDGQVLDACRSLYLKGFVPFVYGDRALFNVALGYPPGAIDNAGRAGVGAVTSGISSLNATPEQRQRALNVIVQYDREYRNLLQGMLIAATASRPRSQLGAIRQIMTVLSKVSFGILAVEGWTSLNTALNTMAYRHGFPFNNVAALNRLKLISFTERYTKLPVDALLKPFFAWEDGRPVSWETPEAEWYFYNNRDQWTWTEGTKQLAGGDSLCSESFANRIDSCSWFGWDACQPGKSIEEKIGGYSKAGGNWVMGILSAWTQSQGACIANLRLEILYKRNIWCYENGIAPPSFPELGNTAVIKMIRLPGENDPNANPCIADPSGPNCFQTPSNSWLGLAIAGGTAGFYTAGPQGAAIGAAIGAVIGAVKK